MLNCPTVQRYCLQKHCPLLPLADIYTICLNKPLLRYSKTAFWHWLISEMELLLVLGFLQELARQKIQKCARKNQPATPCRFSLGLSRSTWYILWLTDLSSFLTLILYAYNILAHKVSFGFFWNIAVRFLGFLIEVIPVRIWLGTYTRSFVGVYVLSSSDASCEIFLQNP